MALIEHGRRTDPSSPVNFVITLVDTSSSMAIGHRC